MNIDFAGIPIAVRANQRSGEHTHRGLQFDVILCRERLAGLRMLDADDIAIERHYDAVPGKVVSGKHQHGGAGALQLKQDRPAGPAPQC